MGFVNNENSKSRKRCRISEKCGSDNDRECNNERTELIHQALASLIATNQLPISFCSSPGFSQFMAVVEPSYKICKDEAMKKRLRLLKSTIEDKIKKELRNAKSVVCTIGAGWSSAGQNAYITLTAHILNKEWSPKSFTLATLDMTSEPHTAEFIAEKLTCILNDWEINGKVTTIVTDNTQHLVNAVKLLPTITIDDENMDVMCAANSLQSAINVALKEKTLSEIIKQCNAVVEHFKHSNVAKKSLLNEQQQLGILPESLVQYCETRRNSIYLMFECLLKNRSPIANVLADRTIISSDIARKIEITKSQWLKIESLVSLLKPLYVVTNLFCSENHSPASMVRPLIARLLDHHLKLKETDEALTKNFKRTIISEIKERFKLSWNETNSVPVKQIASFLDPRYKDLEFESISAKEKIQLSVKDLLEKCRPEINLEQNSPIQRSDLEYLYGNITIDINDLTIQLQTYIAEPPLRFDLNPYDWWKSKENKYPALATLAKQYIAIPASSVSSEKCFSTAENLVTSKRTNLLMDNVNMLMFLYHNRKLLQ